MIENNNEVSKAKSTSGLEKALEQAKQRVANEKKKQNEKKRKEVEEGFSRHDKCHQ
jgi:hypothetical protein